MPCTCGGDLAASRDVKDAEVHVRCWGGQNQDPPDLGGELLNYHGCFYTYLGHLLSFIRYFSGLSVSCYKVLIAHNNLLKNNII